MLNSDIVRRARQADLAAFLASFGVPLVRVGSRHRHKTHDSLVFTSNAYFWNSRGEHGNAIDYLVRHMGFDFQAAVAALAGFVADIDISTPKKVKPKPAPDFGRVFAYLHKSRGISYGLIQELISAKLLFQEAKTNNAVFVMIDENGERVGAEFEGTLSEKRFKGIEAESKYGYGFSVCLPIGSRIATPVFVLFFESALDLLSFVDLKRRQNKVPENCLLVSMAGLKINVVRHMLKVYGGQAVICADADDAADAFAAKLAEDGISYKRRIPPIPHKDWNSVLTIEVFC